jgi:hypothetical protein
VVGHADLLDPPPAGAQLDEQLGREEGAAGFDVDALEGLAPEELAGAVDVPDPEAEGAAAPAAPAAPAGSRRRSIKRPTSATRNWRSPSVNAR